MTKIISDKFFITFMKIEIEEDELKALVAVAEAAQAIRKYINHGNLYRNEADPFGTTYSATVRTGDFANLEIALAALAAIRGQQCTAPLNLLTTLETREAMMMAIAKEEVKCDQL